MVNAAKNELPDVQGKWLVSSPHHAMVFARLPVLFVTVSNHLPVLVATRYQWLVLAIISLAATAGIKHWLQSKRAGKTHVWILPVSVLLLLSVAYAKAPKFPIKDVTDQLVTVQAIVCSKDASVVIHQNQQMQYITLPLQTVWKHDTPWWNVQKNLILQRVAAVLTKN